MRVFCVRVCVLDPYKSGKKLSTRSSAATVRPRRKAPSQTYIPVHQWRDLRIGVICEDLGALTTARAREFWICWSRLS